MLNNTYKPAPIDTQDIVLSVELSALVEKLAQNVHENWSAARIKDGWSYGPNRDDFAKQNPCLVPYELLPDSEKDYDRKIVSEILKTILKLGFKISRD